MDRYILVNKEISQTPLEAIRALQDRRPDLRGVKIGYAGRLDPMAHGLLLLLIGEENKNQQQYFGLDKVYEVTVLFGFSTDTGDVLGIIDNNLQLAAQSDAAVLRQVQGGTDFEKYIGVSQQEYPIYSSKPVAGKPLFQHARDGGLGEIEMPEKQVEIYSIEHLRSEKISKKDLEDLVVERVTKVTGDFRQAETIATWQEAFELIDNNYQYQTITLRIKCSSGAYMRSFAQRIGRDLGVPSLALDIFRTQIGEYTLADLPSSL